MKISVDLDKLKDFIFRCEPQCGACGVRARSTIDCPYKSGTVAKNRCHEAIIKYLQTIKEEN